MEAGHVLGSRYKLERLIGAGGMGQVWSARHLTLGSGAAIKLLGPTSDPALARRRFDREARAAAELRSPHVVHVYDYELEPVPYLVMELLEGQTLRDRLAGGTRLSLRQASWIVTQACAALELARERRIVHRDIKPSNLFMAAYGRHEVLKVLDFGVAWVASEGSEDPVTSSGTVLGSLPYLSPEQAEGAPLDFKSDQWSLAVVAFRMLTGVEPFASGSGPQTVARICSGDRRPATSIIPGLPPELDAFFEQALAIDPKERHGSPTELAEALESVARAAGQGPAEPLARFLARTEATQSFEGRNVAPAHPRASREPLKRLRSRRAAGATTILIAGVLSVVAFAFQQHRELPPRQVATRPSEPVAVHVATPERPTAAIAASAPAQDRSLEAIAPKAVTPGVPPRPRATRIAAATGGMPAVSADVDPIFGLHVMPSPRATNENLGSSRSVDVNAAAPIAPPQARYRRRERGANE